MFSVLPHSRHFISSAFVGNHTPIRTRFNTPTFQDEPIEKEGSYARNRPLHFKPINDEINIRKTIKIGRHIKITAGGRVESFSALILIGTQQGSAAMGYGKGVDTIAAMQNAQRDAERQVKTIYRFEGRTIAQDLEVKYGAAKIVLRTAPPFYGLRGTPLLVEAARCFGLQDLHLHSRGSANPHALLRAFFKAVDDLPSPEEDARSRGRKYVNHNKVHALHHSPPH